MAAIKSFVFGAWTMLWVVIAPVQWFVFATFVLVLSDFITGIIAARFAKGEKIQSSKMKRSVWKLILYTLAILLSHLLASIYFLPKGIDFDLVWIASGVISLTEFKSNLENIAIVTGLDIWNRIEAYIPRLPRLPDQKK
jgi:phosphatidylglycerophosphate synthase